MKLINLSSILAAAIALAACGPSIMYGPKISEPMRGYEEILEVPGKGKDEIFVNTNEWLVENFEPQDFYMEFQDKEAGKIMGEYTFTFIDGLYACQVRQTIDISIKDERLRLRIISPTYAVTTAIDQEYYDSHRPLVTQQGILKAKSRWEWFRESLNEKLTLTDDW